jgi:hypothetical protein
MYVASFTTTHNSILKALEDASGAEWKVTKTTSGEEIKAGQQALEKGDLAGAIPRLVRAG